MGIYQMSAFASSAPGVRGSAKSAGIVDGNNFYVFCERVFEPPPEMMPVAVMSNDDGCCISWSCEFKDLNIHSSPILPAEATDPETRSDSEVQQL